MNFNKNSGFITPQESALLKAKTSKFDNRINDVENEVILVEEDIDTITSAVNQLANDKQDKLTAGDNITIDENNVISATGGKVPADVEYIYETNVGGLNEFTVQNLSDLDYISIGMYIPANTGVTVNWHAQVHLTFDDGYIFTGTHQNVVDKDSARDNIYHFINMGAAGWESPYTNHSAYTGTHPYGNYAGGGGIIIIQHPGKIKSIRCNLYQSTSNLFPTGTTVTVCGI